MQRKIITNTFSVSGQITTDDVSALKTAGIKTIICNRPNNEDQDQTDAERIKKIADEQGIAFHFLPVVSNHLTREDGEAMFTLLSQSLEPIHAYCRSGTRSTTLWAMARLLSGDDKNVIIEQAKNAGYDVRRICE